MKRTFLAIFLLIALIANPVMSQAVECDDVPKHSHSQDEGKVSKTMHVDHHCCHANSFNAETASHSASIDFTSGKIAVEQMQLISLFEPSPIIKPPAQA